MSDHRETLARIRASERFWLRVDRTDTGCWLWTGSLTPDGYGRFWVGSRSIGRYLRAHRWSYEETFGPIPPGLQLDHLCRVRNCVNPQHLEPVDPRTNTLRGDTTPAANARKTHCDNGHEFTPENTYPRPGVDERACRMCRNEARKRYEQGPRGRDRTVMKAATLLGLSRRKYFAIYGRRVHTARQLISEKESQ